MYRSKRGRMGSGRPVCGRRRGRGCCRRWMRHGQQLLLNLVLQILINCLVDRVVVMRGRSAVLRPVWHRRDRKRGRNRGKRRVWRRRMIQRGTAPQRVDRMKPVFCLFQLDVDRFAKGKRFLQLPHYRFLFPDIWYIC